MRILFKLLFAASSLFLSACTVMYSSLDLADEGISYYLPRTLVDVTIVAAAPTFEGKTASAYPLDLDGKPHFLVVTTSTVPDLRQQYRLNYQRNIFFHDRVCVSTQQNGLLNSVEIATEDATPQILVALAALAGSFGGPSFRGGQQDEPPNAARVTFDPFVDREVISAERYLNAKLHLAKPIRIDLAQVRRLGDPKFKTCEGKGVCFRTMVKVPIRIGQSVDEAPTQYIDMVNQGHMGHMELERAMLIENLLALGFENGALTHVMMRRPSQALQAVKLPLAVTNAILAVPGDFVGRIGGSAAALSALNTEATNRASVENTIQTRIAAIEAGLSTRVQGAASSEASTFTLRCRGTLAKTPS